MRQFMPHMTLIGLIVIALALPAAFAPPSAAAQTAPLRIIASFSILADVAQQVAGDSTEVESLIPNGANPHSYEPTAQDVVRLSDADAVLVVGMNFEEGLQTVLDEAAGDRVLTVSTCVPVRAIPTGVVHEDADHAAGDEHATAPDSASIIDCARDTDDLAAVFPGAANPASTLGPLYAVDCAAEGCDPHVWTDPVNVAWWTLALRDAFSALDPDRAELYDANARAYLDELAALDADIAAQIDAVPEAQRYLVTNHVVFNYFAARYGLTPVGVVLPGGSTSAEPSVQDVLALIDAIDSLGVPVIFTEAIASDDLAQQIADEANATLVPLLTGSLDTAGSEAATYLDYMRHNAALIAGALAG